MRIYLFRHGEVYNPDNILYGRLPGFHLSEAGKEGVRKYAQTLPKQGIFQIYTSPLERAVETSQIIADVLGISKDAIQAVPGLIEVDCKSFEGRPVSDLVDGTDYRTNPEEQTATERVKDAGKRILTVLEDLANKGQDCVVVSHGDPIAGALVLLTNDWDEFLVRYPERGTYTVLEYAAGRFTIVR